MRNNLQEWLSYLEALPSGLDNASLKNIKKVAANCNLLNLSKEKYIITVGGTNGKGSCVAFLEAILLAANYKVGAYISPHVIKYNERIRINGANVDDDTLCRAFAKIESTRGNTPLTYFEFGTLSALLIFKQLSLDILVLEVGLGGRFDAVNIVDPNISIITTISLDHIQQLGDNREDIGREKAGIMRPNKPIICGDFDPPQSIYQTAKKINAPIYRMNKEFSYSIQNNFWTWESEKIKLTKLPIPHLPVQNAATSLMTITLMQQNFPISAQAISEGLEKAYLLGRFQVIEFCGLQIILDVAHNQESANLLYKNLKKQKCLGQTLVVTSMLKDKDIAATFKELKNIADKWYIGTLHHARAALQNQLQENSDIIGLKEVFHYDGIIDAFKAAAHLCNKNDRIVVFGSFYTVAEVLKFTQSNSI